MMINNIYNRIKRATDGKVFSGGVGVSPGESGQYRP